MMMMMTMMMKTTILSLMISNTILIMFDLNNKYDFDYDYGIIME